MSTAQLCLLALLVIVAGLLLRELLTVLRAKVPAQTHVVVVGEHAPLCTAEIPKIIWTYWQAAPPPPFIQACLDNWRRFAPDHELRLLDGSSLAAWLPELRADFDDMPDNHQADWLRIQLLARHGGLWMDASMLLSRDLGWLHETRRRRGADYVGFYIDRQSTRPEQPIVANWLMASVPGGRFAVALAETFDRALGEGAESLLQRLRSEGRHARVVQALIDDSQRNLLMQVAASELLDREAPPARLVLLRAEDGPFAWLAAVGWRKHRFYARLALTACPRVMPAVLTLQHDDQAVVERNWLRGRFLAISALAQLVDKAK
jgi:Capsular polysaccharide synthesis protein